MDRNITFIRVIKNCFYKPIFVHNDLHLYALINAQFTAAIVYIGRIFLFGSFASIKEHSLLASFLLACKRELPLRFVANRRRELKVRRMLKLLLAILVFRRKDFLVYESNFLSYLQFF